MTMIGGQSRAELATGEKRNYPARVGDRVAECRVLKLLLKCRFLRQSERNSPEALQSAKPMPLTAPLLAW